MYLLALAVFTGGLHMDGLSDTIDGLSAQGASERKLNAMRDPSAGPLGAASIVFVLLIKYLSIRSLEDLSYFGLFGTLVFMPLMGRWAIVVAMAAGRPAQSDGLGRVYLGRLGMWRLAGAAIVAALCITAVAALLRDYAPSGAYWFLFLSVVLVSIAALVLNLAFNRRFGGQSGDTLGASCETAEMIFLLGALAWSRFFIL
jgi:adenosylcobinamide-GDP ribazoletransferase